jgi:hypothetical protein
VLSRWKKHFEQHLNEGEERDQPPNQAGLPSREEIESAAGTDSIAAELLKNGGSQLVDALE